MPCVWHTFIHFCAFVSSDTVPNCSVHGYGTFKILLSVLQKRGVKALIGFIWHRRGFNGGLFASTVTAPPTVKSLVSSTVTDTRDVTGFHSQKSTMGVACLCIVRSVVSGSSWVHWQRERERERETRRTAVNCGKLPTGCFDTSGEHTAANCTELARTDCTACTAANIRLASYILGHLSRISRHKARDLHLEGIHFGCSWVQPFTDYYRYRYSS